MTGAVESTGGLAPTRLSLMNEFQLLIDERSVRVPHGVQRLLAILAIARAPVHRSRIAGQLWLDVPELRALGNLRSALWRLRRIGGQVVCAMDERLTLHPDVGVDLAELADVAGKLFEAPGALECIEPLVAASDLLPGWEDEWLVVERERFRELRLRALERACEQLMLRGDYDAAIGPIRAVIDTEPFRESAQRLLVRIHLLEGNHAAALRAYTTYRELLETELGIEPSRLMLDLIGELRTTQVGSRRTRRDVGVTAHRS